MSDQEAFAALARDLRRRLEWDAEDGLPGFRPADPERVRAAARAALIRRAQQGSEAAAPTPEATVETEPAVQPLEALRAELRDCRRCALSDSRGALVFGEGPAPARLMFIGDAPSAHDDADVRPFRGPAGALLDKMIEAMGLTRAEVHLTSVVRCRPENDRSPAADEVAACRPHLEAHLRAVAPEVIVTLGELAAHCVLGTDQPLASLRGRFAQAFGAQLMPTLHPAELLASPAKKRLAWDDLKQVITALGEAR
jgi:uracil-DNA glycosylase family 4